MLKWLIVFIFVFFVLLICVRLLWREHKKYVSLQKLYKRDAAVADTYEQWIYKLQQGCSIKSVFEENAIYSVAVYGLGRIGKNLIAELANQNIRTLYCVDKNYGEDTYKEIPCYGIESMLPDADILIITVSGSVDEIKTEIAPITANIKFVKSFQEVLYVL